MLQYIEQQIRQSEAKPGTLIHIGAGTCSELQEYLDLNFSRIVLYEAIPELAEELREKCRGHQQVSIEQAVVAGEEGKVSFHRMNNPRFSSIKEQSALKDYYPNLRSEKLQMDAASLSDSVRKLALSDKNTNILILEALGEETTLLNSVDPDLLQKFSWVIIRTVEYNLLDNRSTDSSNALENGEFISILSTQDLHPFTLIIFKRDDSAISLKARLKIEKEERNLELAEAQHKFDTDKQKLESELKEVKERLESERLAKAEKVKEFEEQLKHQSLENQKLQEELDKLRNEKQELVYRQTALDEEVVKAEAQLELIKDVVIRDKAF